MVNQKEQGDQEQKGEQLAGEAPKGRKEKLEPRRPLLPARLQQRKRRRQEGIHQHQQDGDDYHPQVPQLAENELQQKVAVYRANRQVVDLVERGAHRRKQAGTEPQESRHRDDRQLARRNDQLGEERFDRFEGIVAGLGFVGRQKPFDEVADLFGVAPGLADRPGQTGKHEHKEGNGGEDGVEGQRTRQKGNPVFIGGLEHSADETAERPVPPGNTPVAQATGSSSSGSSGTARRRRARAASRRRSSSSRADDASVTSSSSSSSTLSSTSSSTSSSSRSGSSS